MNIPASTPRELIDAIHTVNLTPGSHTIQLISDTTYLLNSAYETPENGLPTISGNVTIDGGSHATIQRDTGPYVPPFRLFQIAPGAQVTLKNLTITGGLLNVGDYTHGGGILNQGNLILVGCQVVGNHVYGSIGSYGGGVDNDTSDAVTSMTGCTFANNSAVTGGALHNNLGILSISQTIFQSNSAAGNGGAIETLEGSITINENTKFIGNASSGAVVYDHAGTVSIIDSEFTQNSGGAVTFDSVGPGSLTLHNNSLHSNPGTSVANTAAAAVDATHNWWGQPGGPSGAGSGTGDAVSTNVTYIPFISANEPAHQGSCSSTCNGSAFATRDPICTGNPISLQYGEKRETITDFTLNTPAGPLSFTRAYRQSAQTDGRYQFMGLGWTHNHALILTLSGTAPNRTAEIRLEDGGVIVLAEVSSTPGHFVASAGSTSVLDYASTPNEYTLTTPDQLTYVFDGTTFQIQRRTWPSGETWTYTYTSGVLTLVDDGYGRQLQFTYISDPGQFDDGQLWRVGDQDATGLDGSTPAGCYVELAYLPEASDGIPITSPKALLGDVGDVLGNTWTYDYYGQHPDETDASQLDFLTARLSPSVDTTGDGTPDEAVILENLFYLTAGSTITGITQQRGVQADGSALLETDLLFRPNGRNTTLEVNASGWTTHYFDSGTYTKRVDPAGNVTTQSPTSQFRPGLQTDANGHSTQLIWSSDGQYLQQAVDALNDRTQFTYNTNGTLDSSLDTVGHLTQYLYTDATNPRLPTDVKVYDMDGGTVQHWQKFAYDSRGRTQTEQIVDPGDGTTALQQVSRAYYTTGNGNGLLQTVTQQDLVNPANDVTTTYFYDRAGRVVKVNQTAIFGACTSSYTVYDLAGNVLASLCNYDPGANPDPTTVAEALALYDPTVPDKNRVRTYVYDTLGRRVQTTTDAAASFYRITLTVYDGLNRVVRTITNYVADPAIADPYVHDRADFRHGPNNDQNLITETAYNERGLVKRQVDVLGSVTLFGYDAADRLVKTVQNASWPAYNNNYRTGDPSLDAYDSLSDAPDRDLVTSSQYDAAGNLVKATDPLGSVTFTIYDALNRPVTTVRSASVPGYDVAADPTLSRYPFSAAADQDLVATTEYDGLGRVRRRQDVLGNWTLYGYDPLGRLVKTIRNASQPTYNLAADPALASYEASRRPDQDLMAQTVYDTTGRVMYTLDDLGRRTWSAYDGLSRVVKTIINAVGIAIDGGVNDPRSPAYAANAALTDQDQIAVTVYDSSGRVARTQDTLGNWTLYGYDAVNRPVKTVRSASNVFYNAAADPALSLYRPATNAAPDQDVLTQTLYDAQGRVAITIDPLGNQTQFTYDALGRTVRTIANFVTGVFNPARPDQDLVATTTYDLAGRVIATTDVRGTQMTFTYDAAGRRRTVTQAAATGLATTGYTCYDKSGRILRVIQNWIADPRQPSPDAQDERGNWRFNPLAHGRANDQNLVTTYILDRLGRTLRVSNPLGNTAMTTYYPDGLVESTTDPLGVVTQYRYDAARRRLTVVTSFQDNGQDPALWLWNGTAWTKRDGVTAIAFGAANDQNLIVRAEYDKVGRLTALRDPRGNRTTYTYDLLDRRTSLADPLGNAWTTAYTNLSSVQTGQAQVTLTDPLGTVIQQTTDRLGRLSRIAYLDESPKLTPDVTFTYDPAGSRLSMTETSGASAVRKTSYGYDQAHRLTRVDFDVTGDGSDVQTVAYQYEPGGLRTRLTLPDSSAVSYTYNARGQLVRLADWASQSTAFAYDALGRLAAISRSTGLRSQYQYDAAGRLRQLRHSAASQTLGAFVYAVDARGNRTQVFEAVPQASTGATTLLYNDPGVSYYLGAWTAANPYQVTTNFSAALQLAFFGSQATLTMGEGPDHSIYDVYVDGDLWQSPDGYAATAGDQVLTITCTGDGPHVLDVRNRPEKNRQSTGYTLRFKSLATPSSAPLYDLQTVAYAYDALARLVGASAYPGLNTAAPASRQYAYAYDTAGNRTQRTITVGGTPTVTNYTYDTDNRLVSDSTHTFSYDNAGRLTSDGINSYAWDRANRLLSMGGSAYLYNGLGQRVQQTADAQVTQYLLDIQPGLWQVLATTQGTNVTRYVHGPTGLLEQQNSDTTWRWPVMDGLGSVRGVVDSTIAPQSSQQFSPFGELYGTTGTSQTVFGFSGEPTDDSGLVYLRARYYNPALGVFPSLDPLEGGMSVPMSLNRYGYVRGNVVNQRDPSGLLAQHDIELWQLLNPCARPPIPLPDPCDCWQLLISWGIWEALECRKRWNEGKCKNYAQSHPGNPSGVPVGMSLPVPGYNSAQAGCPEGFYVTIFGISVEGEAQVYAAFRGQVTGGPGAVPPSSGEIFVAGIPIGRCDNPEGCYDEVVFGIPVPSGMVATSVIVYGLGPFQESIPVTFTDVGCSPTTSLPQ